MKAPGTEVTIGERTAPRLTPTDTGTAFILAPADRGPVDEATELLGLSAYTTPYGPRASYSFGYDVLDVAFRAGLTRAVFLRLVGPAAKVSTKNLKDGETDTLQADAISPGAWGDKISVETEDAATAGSFHVLVKYDGALVEKSPELVDKAAAVAWAAQFSSYILLTDLGAGADPDEQTVTLAGGADDRENIDAEVIEGALELLTADYGPGQVCVVGNTSAEVHEAVIDHCAVYQRTPILDLADTPTKADLVTAAAALRVLPEARRAGAFAPWITAPGVSEGTTRTLPPSAKVLGEIAKVDRETGNPNAAAAGPTGKSAYPDGVTQSYTETERAELNEAGVNVLVMDEGEVTTMGFRTLADPVTNRAWVPLTAARLAMTIAHNTDRVLRRQRFKQLDAQGTTKAAAESAIVTDVIAPLAAVNAFYGLTGEEAVAIAVEQEVKPTDGTVGKLIGSVSFRPSPFAERLEFTVFNVPADESL